MKILIINGPNLNLLGKRQPEIYGSMSFETYLTMLQKLFPDTEIEYYQSNVEGEIINALQQAETRYHGIILNAGGFTHTSVAIGDCVAAVTIPVVEVHISNILARESFRHQSMLSPHVKGVITGFGMAGYELACYYLIKISKET